MEANFDAVVIGSGFGAAPPALRLAQAGFKVLVLEKGPYINPAKDFRKTQNVSYLRKYYKHYPGKGLGVNVVEGFGGGSGFYLGISLRAPSLVFNMKDTQGESLWPEGVNRSTMDPFYARAESMLNVTQIAESDIPKNGQLFSMLMKQQGYSADRARLAVVNCQHCGYCISGCKYGAKQSLMLNYLPDAHSNGAKILCGIAVDSIDYHPDERFKYSVYAKSTNKDATTYRIQSNFVILGAGTVGSSSILLRSKKSLRRLSPTLGKNLRGNLFYKELAIIPEHYPDGEMFNGIGIPGIVSYEFLESHQVVLIPYKALPVQLLAKVKLGVPAENGGFSYWGKEHVKLMRKIRKRVFILTASGYMEDAASIKLNGKGEVKIDLKISDALKTRSRNIDQLLRKILSDGGCTPLKSQTVNWTGDEYDHLQFDSTHPVGSCNMADHIGRGTVNSYGEVFGYPGLFVTDGAAVPTSPIVPPSLTILAIAERASDYMVQKCRNHENH